MKKIEDFLGEGEFTEKGRYARAAAENISGPFFEGIDSFLMSFGHDGRKELYRKRSADRIIYEQVLNCCVDSGLVFVTLARIRGIPAAYVETVMERFMHNIPSENELDGHIFCDVYKNGIWISRNPEHGTTKRNGKVYTTNDGNNFVEIGRGLDFSQLYNDELQNPFSAKNKKQTCDAIAKIATY
jgi:hypothetical protein